MFEFFYLPNNNYSLKLQEYFIKYKLKVVKIKKDEFAINSQHSN